MRVAVIGAGAAGLCSARHLNANNFECIVFEQTNEVGGTWVYTDQVGFDKYGLPVHTSMYQGLKTNLPKETMGFPDYPIPESDRSYLPQEDILKFLNDFTDHFNLRKYIKFYNHVKHLHPIANDRWELLAMDVRTKGITRYEFDAVMVCNGHYHTPNLPDVAGAEGFHGLLMHSHDYRSAAQFNDMDVLIIGAGPSGVDLVLHTSEKAKRIIFSHHSKENIESKFPSNVIQKPDVRRVCEDKVIFIDETEEHIDAILYCTGFKYTFPFMSPDCGIIVDDNYVKPLYKHLINIERPTMALVGLPFYVCAFQMFDIQVRLFLKTLTNQITLPSKEDMLKESKEQMSARFNKGLSKHQAHMMGPEQINYYNDVTEFAKLDPVPNVMTKMHNKSSERFIKDIAHFREDVFKIIDDENFEARFFVLSLKGDFQLPDKESMQLDTDKDMGDRWKQGMKRNHAHGLGDRQKTYFDDLARMASIPSLTKAALNIYEDRKRRAKTDVHKYKDDVYKLIDDEHFIVKHA